MKLTTAAILSIGDELAFGQTADTNAPFLAARLAARGIAPTVHMTVADDRTVLADSFRRARRTADLIIATGGLGPTDDDLTRFALADVLKSELTLDPDALRHIESFYARRHRPMPDRNRVQAMCPAGARTLTNPVGTAPGLYTELGPSNPAIVFCLPGVPAEMRAMFDLHVEPLITQHARATLLTATLHTFGAGESDIADHLGDLTRRDRNPLVGTTVSEGIVSVRIRAASDSPDDARRQLDATAAEVESRLGTLVFGREDNTLPDVVARLLRDRHRTLATAESCTAGLLAKLLTDPAGASDYYLAGWVVYSNDAKHRDLHIPLDLLQRHGAVSQPVALALAENARQTADADHALAITGIAGPSGATPDKPLGTVHLALANRDTPPLTQHHTFPGDRPAIRHRAALAALNLLRLRLL